MGVVVGFFWPDDVENGANITRVPRVTISSRKQGGT